MAGFLPKVQAFAPAEDLISSGSLALKVAVRFGSVQPSRFETSTQCRMPPGCFYQLFTAAFSVDEHPPDLSCYARNCSAPVSGPNCVAMSGVDHTAKLRKTYSRVCERWVKIIVKLVAHGVYISTRSPTGVQLPAISSVPGRVHRHARLCEIQWLLDTKDCSASPSLRWLLTLKIVVLSCEPVCQPVSCRYLSLHTWGSAHCIDSLTTLKIAAKVKVSVLS
jgi:hypothetical protein